MSVEDVLVMFDPGGQLLAAYRQACATEASAGPDLRAHVAVDHHQEASAGDVSDATLVGWHDWEHRPHPTTHLGHAHDELTARRLGVALVQKGSDAERTD